MFIPAREGKPNKTYTGKFVPMNYFVSYFFETYTIKGLLCHLTNDGNIVYTDKRGRLVEPAMVMEEKE